eukprot:14504-Pelagomonas_calceolata.AAC.1
MNHIITPGIDRNHKHSAHIRCNEMVALGHNDQAKTGGRMPLLHLPIPLLRNGRTCTPSLWLPAHS